MPDKLLKILIIIRAGRDSLHPMFARFCGPYADIAVSTFEDVDWTEPGIAYAHYARGGKYQGISDFFVKNPQLLNTYDYFWFFEDDLEMQPETVAAVHTLLTRFRFMLAAPALTPDSHYSWTIAVRHTGLLFRGTDFVEQMAPIMSRAFLRAALPHFAESYTGFGYEWLWQRILRERNGYAAILDSAPIRHGRPLGSGMLYKNRPEGSNNEQEMRDFINKLGLDSRVGFSNRFALTAEDSPRLLTGDALAHAMTESFWQCYPEDKAKAEWCVNELMHRYRPQETLDELRKIEGFTMVEAATVPEVPERLAELSHVQKWPVNSITGNLALGKPATQSSVNPWFQAATPELDAAMGNNGKHAGTYGFQTAFETDPWWQVDLQGEFSIGRIVVFNRLDNKEACRHFSVSSSFDGETWHLRGAKLDDEAFGGADGKPYSFVFEPPFNARFVRVQLIGEGHLYLDEIEVYEEQEAPVIEPPPRVIAAPAKIELPSEAEPLYHTAVVVCARWETDYIEEWLTYYQCIGYEHVYLYCNDDDPAELYGKILSFTTGRFPFVTFTHFEGQGLQYAMYMHFIENFAREVRWVSFFDVDEFLRIADGSMVEKFLLRFDDDVDCILFNWRVFGTSGHKTNPPGKVLENYTRCAGDINSFTKFIGRAVLLVDGKLQIPDFAFGFWHSLFGKLYRPVKVVNVLGATERKQNYQGVEAEQILQTAVLHHYLLRSEEAALRRVARGMKGDFSGQSIWDASNPWVSGGLNLYNDEEDLSLASFWRNLAAKGRESAAQPVMRRKLLSRGKPCTQSSLSEWSTGATLEEDAGAAVNGKIDGTQKFHTEKEANPWWQVDLEEICPVTRIVVYNAAFHTRDRLKNLEILASNNAIDWRVIHVKADDEPVGSLLTGPFILDFVAPISFRYFRIVMIGENFLHLDQVEIYGEALE